MTLLNPAALQVLSSKNARKMTVNKIWGYYDNDMIGKEVFKLQQIPCSPFGRNGVSLLWIPPSMKVYLTWSGPRKQGQDTFQKRAKSEFGD